MNQRPEIVQEEKRGRFVDVVSCPECGKSFIQKNVYRHLWNQHNWSKQECRQLVTLIKTEKKMQEEGTNYACAYCNVLFKTVAGLLKHRKLCHIPPTNSNNEPNDVNADEIIDPVFIEEEEIIDVEAPLEPPKEQGGPSTSSEDLEIPRKPVEEPRNLQHEALKCITSGNRYRASTIVCPECDVKVDTCDELVSHCRQAHTTECRRFIIEQLTFQDKEGFKKWFDRRQEDTCTSLTKRTGHGGETFYRCHMIGKYSSVAKKRKSNPRKIDQSCTAFLKVFRNQDGTYFVCGCFTHIGHELNHRLLWLTETQENYVRELLDMNWTHDQIYYYIREEYNNYECKLKYISKNDIRNIAVRYERAKKQHNQPKHRTIQVEEQVLEEVVKEEVEVIKRTRPPTMLMPNSGMVKGAGRVARLATSSTPAFTDDVDGLEDNQHMDHLTTQEEIIMEETVETSVI